MSPSEAELRRALEAARAHVGDLVTARHQAAEEARRLRERAQAGEGLADLVELAERHEQRAKALAADLEPARLRAHEAEVALERALAGKPPAPGSHRPATGLPGEPTAPAREGDDAAGEGAEDGRASGESDPSASGEDDPPSSAGGG